jgi:hypothetical protein
LYKEAAKASAVAKAMAGQAKTQRIYEFEDKN